MNIDIVLFAHRDWIKLKKHPQPCDTPTISLSPAFNLRFNHSPPSEGLGEARGPQKKPPDFTPMAWCFAINQTLSLAAT
jgi:hypothetical protein